MGAVGIGVTCLRGKGLGVADVGGPLVVQVVGQTGIGREHAALVLGLWSRGWGHTVVEVLLVLVAVVGQPAAENELELVGQGQTGHAIGGAAYLGQVLFLVGSAAHVLGRIAVAQVNRNARDQAGTLDDGADGVGVVDTEKHVVVQVEGVEATLDVAVDRLAHAAALVRELVPGRSGAGDRVDAAEEVQASGVTVDIDIGQVGGQ
ncbi:hypothetical protein D3C77_247420 [compost metagenome]